MTYENCYEMFAKKEVLRCDNIFIATGINLNFINTLLLYNDCEFDTEKIYVLHDGGSIECDDFGTAFSEMLYLIDQKEDSDFITDYEEYQRYDNVLDVNCFNPKSCTWHDVDKY